MTVQIFSEEGSLAGLLPTSVLQNPLFLLASSCIIFSFSMVYTSTKPILRFGAFGFIAAYIYHIFRVVDLSQIPPSTIYIYVCTQTGVLLYASYFLCLEPRDPPSSDMNLLQKLIWGIGLLTNPRGIGTSWEIKHVPLFSRKNPTYIPTRISFIAARTLSFIFFVTLSTASNHVDRAYYWPSLRDGEYSSDRERLIRRLPNIDFYEVLVRLYLPLQTRVPTYSDLSAAHAALSVLAVLCGDEPGHWPPLFGSPADAYSLRRYYASFWQLIFRKAFVAHASFFTNDLLGVRRGTRLSRGLITLCVFAISAGMHSLSTKLSGKACEIGPVVHWYCLVVAGIFVEDFFEIIWPVCERLMAKRVSAPRKNWQYAMGYIWVWIFFAWSLPKLFYRNFGCMNAD